MNTLTQLLRSVHEELSRIDCDDPSRLIRFGELHSLLLDLELLVTDLVASE